MALEKLSAAPQRLGKYELLKERPGGIGSTWIARVTGGAELYSIVRIHKHVTKKLETAEAFVSDVKPASRLDHPNAAAVVDTGIADGEVFVVSQHEEGETLAGLMTAAGAAGLPAPVVMRVGLDALGALAAAHALDPALVHGELAPQHVRIGASGHAKIIGFGVARALTKLSSLGAGKNSERLAYAAPERVKAMAAFSTTAPAPEPSADVFSAAVLLWEGLSKQRLFASKIDAAVIQKVLTAPIASLSTHGVSAALDEAIVKALDRDPARRTASAKDLLAAIEAAGVEVASHAEVAELVEKLSGKAIAAAKAEIQAAIDKAGAAPASGVKPTAPAAKPIDAKPASPAEDAPEAPPAKDAKPAAPAPETPKPTAPVVQTPKPIGRALPARKATLLGVSPGTIKAPAVEAKPAGDTPKPDMARPAQVRPVTMADIDVEEEVSIDVDDGPMKVDAAPAKAAPPPPPAPAKAAPAPPKPAPPSPGKRPQQTLLMGTPVKAEAPKSEKIEKHDIAPDSPTVLLAKVTGKAEAPKAPATPAAPHAEPAAAASPVSERKPMSARDKTPASSKDAPASAKETPASAKGPREVTPSDGPSPRGRTATAIDKIGPGATLGRYEILMPVARGGMASVWAARLQGTRGFQKIVAIKTMLPDVSDDPDFETMFLDEARVAAKIRHPNVAEILDLGEQDEVLYLVMEWVEGDNLSALLKAARPLGGIPLPIVLRVASQVCAGLHAAHELRDDNGALVDLVHRDVSPANILVSTAGFVKIVDFGIAKSNARVHVTRAGGMVKGKTPYLSPEQLTAQPIDRRSDIFSFGALLYVLTTGLHPFRGESEGKTVENIALREPVPLTTIQPSIPAEFDRIVQKALAKEPNDRYATAAELQRALDTFAVSLGAATSEEDVAAFVREAIGEAQAKRALELKAAIAAVDGLEARPPSSTESSKDPKDEAAIVRAQLPTQPRLDGDGAGKPKADAAKPDSAKFEAGGANAFDDAALGEADAERSPSLEIPPPPLTADAAPGEEVTPGSAASDLDGDAEAIEGFAPKRNKKLGLIVGAALGAAALLGVIAIFAGGSGSKTPAGSAKTEGTTVATAVTAPATAIATPPPTAAETAPPPATAAETAAPPATAATDTPPADTSPPPPEATQAPVAPQAANKAPRVGGGQAKPPSGGTKPPTKGGKKPPTKQPGKFDPTRI